MEQNVLTLIANPATPALDQSLVDAVRQGLKELGGDVGRPDWLAPGIACDIPFALLSRDQADAAARERLVGQPIDVVALVAEGRRKRLLIADMDATIVIGETLDELADFAGIKEQVAAITARAMNGEIDFPTALRERVGMLAGLPVDTLRRTYEQIELMPGARELVQTMRASGAHTVLVSGGFRYFTSRIRERVGFHLDESNEFEIADEKLTGRVIEPILGREEKLKALIRHAAALHVPLADSLAVGDGANDLPMIQAAGLGVAYCAKPVVAAQAHVRIVHGDLTALLYAQGYRAADIGA